MVKKRSSGSYIGFALPTEGRESWGDVELGLYVGFHNLAHLKKDERENLSRKMRENT
jgi:hypothetical protein